MIQGGSFSDRDGSRPRHRDRATVVDGLVGVALAIAALRLYRASAPAVVNLDGLGYLKQMSHNFAAGHLLYLPLLAGSGLCAICTTGFLMSERRYQ